MVYTLLKEKDLIGYYDFDKRSGSASVHSTRIEKYDFLELASVEAKLISFKSDEETYITFELPQINCSSCLYLLENLPRLNPYIRKCTVNFPKKKAELVFNHCGLSFRELVILLTRIGYEPRLSLDNLTTTKSTIPRQLRLQLGIAAFCFGNIMLLSFPEYLGLDEGNTMPCGMVYFALVTALNAGSVPASVIFMLIFGTGTLPAMLALNLGSHRISMQSRLFMKKFVPWFIFMIAVLLIIRGMNLGLPFLSPYQKTVSGETIFCEP